MTQVQVIQTHSILVSWFFSIFMPKNEYLKDIVYVLDYMLKW